MKCYRCGKELTTGDNNSSGPCNACAEVENTLRPKQYGWICPRCGTVHAPFICQCSCQNQQTTWTVTGDPRINANT